MLKIVIITQNIKLLSIKKLQDKIDGGDKIIILSTHYLFSYEREYISLNLPIFRFITFAELLTDAEMEWCDKKAYELTVKKKRNDDLSVYYDLIKVLKNEIVFKNLKKNYGSFCGYLCADDLGVSREVWLKHDFKELNLEYFYSWNRKQGVKTWIKQILKKSRLIRKTYYRIRNFYNTEITDEIYTATDGNKKYVFIGSMNRIQYRLDMEWRKSPEEYERIKEKRYEKSDKCQYLSTLHEKTKCPIPNKKRYDIRFIQDGYLPPNYTSLYLKFVPNNVSYYAWDFLGTQIFRNQNIPVSILPFRKKMYLPMPIFKKTVKKVLIVTSGAGDWTAIKNRSDEDLMVVAIGEMALALPDIEFIYRCHPVWVHPMHQGVNSINRVKKYFSTLGLSNIKVSNNIIDEDLENFKLSLPRKSLEEDLIDTDFVLGEHSIAMIDSAFKRIPFASVNFTGRRNLFCGITDLGFPYFEKISEAIEYIKIVSINEEVQKKYNEAISNYNKMTDID